ncbi:hypothetical protein BCR33DRAFT_719120 [Rhizoclosmatium globosum]|uniref:BHLH domain-containing protein n=1 Tax=Rhizoclosmatium globosum TaxID=329046 RepID=A0A1Y2C2B0_9FUNG|nr:hypothetical protein BCR33DRAFT_719120 [Rhizoclosmatium globosum]|eukprot:ORY41024.1 hypothetical protein BCR33DRAFT_719120 [Rhizoclosmatium globosum]
MAEQSLTSAAVDDFFLQSLGQIGSSNQNLSRFGSVPQRQWSGSGTQDTPTLLSMNSNQYSTFAAPNNMSSSISVSSATNPAMPPADPSLRRITNPAIAKPMPKAFSRITPSQLLCSPRQRASAYSSDNHDSSFDPLFSPIATRVEQPTPQTFALSNILSSPVVNNQLQADIMGFSPQIFGNNPFTPLIGPQFTPVYTSEEAAAILSSPIPYPYLRNNQQTTAAPLSPMMNRATPTQIMNSLMTPSQSLNLAPNSIQFKPKSPNPFYNQNSHIVQSSPASPRVNPSPYQSQYPQSQFTVPRKSLSMPGVSVHPLATSSGIEDDNGAHGQLLPDNLISSNGPISAVYNPPIVNVKPVQFQSFKPHPQYSSPKPNFLESQSAQFPIPQSISEPIAATQTPPSQSLEVVTIQAPRQSSEVRSSPDATSAAHNYTETTASPNDGISENGKIGSGTIPIPAPRKRGRKPKPEVDRREYRKEAEKNRRDLMRSNYAQIKDLTGNPVKNASKEQMLEGALNYIAELQRMEQEKSQLLSALENEVNTLKKQMGL